MEEELKFSKGSYVYTNLKDLKADGKFYHIYGIVYEFSTPKKSIRGAGGRFDFSKIYFLQMFKNLF